jgi:hypothetical protein
MAITCFFAKKKNSILSQSECGFNLKVVMGGKKLYEDRIKDQS